MHTTPMPPSHDEIRAKTLEKFGKTPCLLQIKICLALLQRKKHVVCSASTGFGKTLTFMMPLLFDETGIMIVVTALNVLGEQNVTTLQSVGIPSIALNSETNNAETFKVHGNLYLELLHIYYITYIEN
jgi:superfamily II DNA helicase RecQ